tara:strand:+ start:508 stop:753 length:246 start_codon:yes stop_codon:yes gene_type:complete
MDKNGYKEIVAEQLQEISEIKEKLEQQTQDFHFDMRNKQMEIVLLQNKIDKIEKHRLSLIMQNGELKDMVLNLGGDYEQGV